MEKRMSFARWTFRLGGIYGLLVMTPQLFFEAQVGRDYPPPITHPEYFYGFVGVALAWQVAFLIIGQDPVRYRPIMLAAVIEKISFAVAAIALFAGGRLPEIVLVFGMIDLSLALAFSIAFAVTPARLPPPAAPPEPAHGTGP
jgi:hypothetical protein